MGYNCLAIDQRSGGDFAGKTNNTATRAKTKGFPMEMIDARQDIAAAIDYLHTKYNQKVIVWGSSYSASLALMEGLSNNKVKAVIAFSPGDYFGGGVPSLSKAFAAADKPYWVTSSQEEAQALKGLIGGSATGDNQVHWVPESEGFHGSRSLWIGQEGAPEAWEALIDFLNKVVTMG